MTGTGTSNFSAAHVDSYIRKKLLELGDQKYLWRKFVNKERIEAGSGTSWKALRYSRLDVPLAGLTEGVAPTETDLEISSLTATATQYGLTVKITDVLQLTVNHKVVQKSLELKADTMAALDDRLIAEQAISGTNVFYGGTATTRGGLSATGGDVLTTNVLRKMGASLRSTDGVAGKAPSPAGMEEGTFPLIVHEKQIYDVQKDTTWDSAAVRQDLPALKSAKVKMWGGFAVFPTSFIPVFECLSSGTGGGTALTDGVAVTSTKGLNGFIADVRDGQGSLADGTYYVKVTRRHKKRGFEEGISSEHTIATGALGGDADIVFTMPSDTNYVYSLYVGSATGDSNLKRVALNVAAGSTKEINAAADFATGANPPVTPPRHTSSATDKGNDVYTAWALAGDAIAVIDLQDLVSYMTSGPDSSNPLNQFVIIGSKFMEGTAVLQNLFMARAETQSAFGS